MTRYSHVKQKNMAWQQPPAVCYTCRSHLSSRRHQKNVGFLTDEKLWLLDLRQGKKKTHTHTLCDVCVSFFSPTFFFFVRTVKCNCSVSAHILIRNGKMSHSKQTATDPGSQQTSLSLQSISGSSTGLSKQHCSAGGEAEKDFMFFLLG